MIVPACWRYELPGPVFRIMAGPDGLVALELRDVATHAVRFQVVRIEEGVIGKDICVPEQPWLVHLAHLTHRALWLHGYADPQLPQPSGLYCVSPTGELQWHAPNCRLLHVGTTEVVVAERVGESSFRHRRLDAITGFVVGAVRAAELAALAPLPERLQQPVLLTPDDALYPQVFARLQARAGIQPEGPVQVLQADGVTYISGGNTLGTWLLAIAKQQVWWRLDWAVNNRPLAFALADGWLLVLPENPELIGIPHPPT